MKRVDFKKQSSVFYIGKGLIIGAIVITASLGFSLGFFVGRQMHPYTESSLNSTSSLLEREPLETTEGPPVAGPPEQPIESPLQSHVEKNMQTVQKQHGRESGTTPPVRLSEMSSRNDTSFSSQKTLKQAAPQSAVKTKQAQESKPSQGSSEKNDTKSIQDKQQTTKGETTRKYTVQVGAFKNAEESDALLAKLHKKGYKAFATTAKTKKQQILHKVMVGEYNTRKEAEVLSIKLKNSEGLRTFVTFFMKEGTTRQH